MKKKYIFILCLLFLIAAVPRGIEILNHNYLFGFDQGEHLLQAKKIIFDKRPILIGAEVGGQRGFFQGPGWYYLLALSVMFSNGDPFAAMILMFLLGVGAVLFAFYFVKQGFNEKTAFAVSLLIAISPAIIIQSRFIWPPFPVSFLTVFLLFFLFKVLQKKQIYLPFLFFTLGLITHFETAAAATLLINFIFFSPIIFIKKLVSLRMLFISFIALLATQLPLIIFDIRHDFLNMKGILSILVSSSTKMPFDEVFNNRWNVFKDNFIGTFPSGNILWPILLIIIIFGVFNYIRNKENSFAQKSFVSFLFISPITLFIIFIKYGAFMWSWWILEINVFYCYLFGIVIVSLLKKKFFVLIIAGLFSFFIISYVFHTIQFYKNDFNDYGGVHKIKGKIQAIDYIYNDAHGQPFNVMVFTPPVYTYAFEYLFWWYGEKKYHYLPKSEKKGILYLLMEPDPQKPWSHEGWLETVIKSGTILKSKQLSPSGFIIEKRLMD